VIADCDVGFGGACLVGIPRFDFWIPRAMQGRVIVVNLPAEIAIRKRLRRGRLLY
jgi:hypothetical protein